MRFEVKLVEALNTLDAEDNVYSKNGWVRLEDSGSQVVDVVGWGSGAGKRPSGDT